MYLAIKNYDYIVKWCSGIACNWCVQQDKPIIIALIFNLEFSR